MAISCGVLLWNARWWQYRVVSCCGMHGGGNIVLCLVVECTGVAISCGGNLAKYQKTN